MRQPAAGDLHVRLVLARDRSDLVAAAGNRVAGGTDQVESSLIADGGISDAIETHPKPVEVAVLERHQRGHSRDNVAQVEQGTGRGRGGQALEDDDGAVLVAGPDSFDVVGWKGLRV